MARHRAATNEGNAGLANALQNRIARLREPCRSQGKMARSPALVRRKAASIPHNAAELASKTRSIPGGASERTSAHTWL